MITVYTLVDEHLEQGDITALSPAALWIDLLEPTVEEKEAVQAMLAIDIPTREEMQEIEASSRLYRESDALYMTAPILSNVDSRRPQGAAITFILTRLCTITVRYATPLSFITFAHRATRQRGLCMTPDAVLSGLLETIIDRIADIMERIGNDLDSISHEIFRPDYQDSGDTPPKNKSRNDLPEVLRSIGRNGDLSSKARDTILGIGRMISFLSQGDDMPVRREIRLRAKTMTRDIRSLTEHASFLSNKINFLLDATLGMINIEQNNIIKIFSVVAVVFLPPTLIASIYGMNFPMPELEFKYGYVMALLMMVFSVASPYIFFKRKGWL